MNIYNLYRVETIDERMRNQVRNLMNLIEDEDIDKDAATDMINPENGLFGAFCEDVLQGFVYATGPMPVYPKRAYIYFAALHHSVPREVSNALFKMVCDWCREQGADHLWTWTRRPRAMGKLYGFKASDEWQLRREL